MTTPKELFDKMQESFTNTPEKYAGVEATYLFKLTGEGGGDWGVELVDGKGTVTEGGMEDPKCTITMETSDYVDMVTAKARGEMLFMTGKLKVTGDMGLALKLQKLFI